MLGEKCKLSAALQLDILFDMFQAERVQFNQESFVQSRTGLHAFQAVPSRTTYERDFPFQSSIRPHFSVSPKAVHQAGMLFFHLRFYSILKSSTGFLL